MRPNRSRSGGGILRVRPDGTELEVFATGLRNPFAIAIDPYLNLFTRDNTNDGAGWDVRVSHLIQTADYGYSQRFANFPDEIMPPLGAYGQGGGTGALFLQDERWPEPYRGSLLTGDWGRSEVYRHDLQPAGATFRATQEVFLNIPRPTGMDQGADGRLFLASWRGGEASVYVGPQVGFIKPGAKIAQGYEAYTFAMADGRVFSGFIVSEGAAVLQIRESSGVLRELKRADIAERRRQESSAMPEGTAGNSTPEQLADLVAYLQSLD